MTAEPPPVDVLVVAVSYFGSADLAALLASLRAGGGAWRLVAVDNAGDPAEHRAVIAALGGEPRAVVVDAQGNLGYLGGARLALGGLGGPPAPWTVVTNTDVRFTPDFVTSVAALPGDAVVAPAIVSDLSGSDQNPFLERRPSRHTVLRWRVQFATVPVARLVVALGRLGSSVRRLVRRRTTSGVARTVYAPHGSCLVLPAAYFDRGGTLDHGAFLFGEEITVAERARALGLPVRYEPAVVVRHAEHRSTGWWRSRQLLTWQRESVREIARVLEGRGP